MSCPYYEDFTRLCITRFPRIKNFMNFSTCQSEQPDNCVVYIVLHKPFNCKYLDRCAEEAMEEIPLLLKYIVEENTTIQLFKRILLKYCTSEQKHAECANFKSLEQGIEPPIELLPNGKKIKITDILLKKEITIE